MEPAFLLLAAALVLAIAFVLVHEIVETRRVRRLGVFGHPAPRRPWLRRSRPRFDPAAIDFPQNRVPTPRRPPRFGRRPDVVGRKLTEAVR